MATISTRPRRLQLLAYGLGVLLGLLSLGLLWLPANDKLHARGPVGLDGLTSLKYIVMGHGEIRS